ncbi:hypothetical protein RN001_005278 [Aquatica leii]|uniref:Uncharacterized protein n=1 Tax=Aquatica leii TaxID=1421715 RepID=A0AAN7Q089_9COLE|nr:hypothetical protein RN001_005278 [Aquatica leii]
MYTRKSKRIENKITATSTPNPVCEQSLQYLEKNFSPILKRKEKRNSNTDFDSSDDNSDEWSVSEATSSSTPIFTKNKCIKPDVTNNYIHVFSHLAMSQSRKFLLICGAIAIIDGVLGIRTFPNDMIINSTTLIEVQTKFPSQSKDTWDAISSGINEVKLFNKPSIYFLQTVSRYASGILNDDYNTQPIVLTSNHLNTIKARSDYGYIINKYKPELEEKSVMVVKNLDKIPGEIAQAFHSMCDEISPLVPKAMFIFTIQIKNFTSEKSDFELIEDILRRSWQDLDDDIFYPLVTRISSMVLRIEPENML